MPELQGRYIVYGFEAVDRESNAAFEPRDVVEQHRRDARPVYATDDRWEAKRIVGTEGGFIRNDRFIVCVGALDTETQGIYGFVPAEG